MLPLEDRLTPGTFTVNSLLDGSSGSGSSGTLRYCIAQTNADPGADTINFAVNGTIMLANGQLIISDTTGTTTINGPGPNLLTIDAHGASRAILIGGDGAPATINGVTVAHGDMASGFGGGIASTGTLTLTDCVITGNTADDGGGGVASIGFGGSGGVHAASLSSDRLLHHWKLFQRGPGQRGCG